MKVIVQRCKKSSVVVDDNVVGKIKKGLMLLVGFTDGDNSDNIDYMVKKILGLRIFDDENGIMNKNIFDVEGEILSVSQFTLYADSSKGNRPSYAKAMKSDLAVILYDEFNKKLSEHIHVETGVFGAEMLVNIENDGPITIILER